MLIKGPNIGKNIAIVVRTYWIIDFVGTIFIITLFAVPSKPISPKKNPITLPMKPKMVFGMSLITFLVFILILSQRLLC